MNNTEIEQKKLHIAKHGVWAKTRAGERIRIIHADGKFIGALYACFCKSPFTEWDASGKNELARCDDLIEIDGAVTRAAHSPLVPV